MNQRDRDAAGRARNARPRDAAGRPLPHGAVGVERVPEDLVLTPDEAVTEAQRLLDAGLPFQSHEVLEGAWKAAPEAQRELWRALAQLAVGLTHAQRGNARGAVSLLDRAAEHLRDRDGPVPAGIDVDGLRTHAGLLARRIEATGTEGLADSDLRPRLRRDAAGGAA
jgi:predicted metal-dependent hydrolase